MTIENLIKAVPPPEEPFEPFRGTWELIEGEIGTVLPQDYKEFARVYGNGYFMEFLGICVPRSKYPNVVLRNNLHFVRRAVIDSGYTPEELPYPFWPEPGGLLAFGGTDNGDSLLWLTQGGPEDWKVVVWDRGLGEFEVLDCGLTDFLAGLASGVMRPKEFPVDLLPCERLFAPSRDPETQGGAPQQAWKVAARLQFSWSGWRAED